MVLILAGDFRQAQDAARALGLGEYGAAWREVADEETAFRYRNPVVYTVGTAWDRPNYPMIRDALERQGAEFRG